MKNFVIIGFGGMGGGFHYKHAINSDVVKLVGAYDVDPVKNQKARDLGIRTYDSFEQLLDDSANIDIATIAIPNDAHLDVVLRCLEAGINVICEKPAALSSADLQKMIDTSKKTGSLFTVHQNRRWDVDHMAMKKIHDENIIGECINIESRIHGSRGIPSDWRGKAEQGGGMLYDWGVHLIDQVMQTFAVPVRSLQCRFEHITNDEVDDGFKLTLFFADGKEAYIEVETYNFIAMPRFYMRAKGGSAIIEDWRKPAHIVKCLHWHESEVIPIETAAGLTKTMAPRDSITVDEFDIEKPASDVHDFYRNFCRAIDGVEEQYVTHEQVMNVMRIMETAFESAANDGKTIQL